MRAIKTMDYAGYIIILIFVSIVAWLSNREINISLKQARKSEKSLIDERDSLENIVSKRTKELIESERLRNAELEKNAQFGELSRGLFHDLMNPLTSLSLFIENMATNSIEPNKAREMIERTIAASRRMESFMNSIRRATADATVINNPFADLKQELETVRDLLAYKARISGVKININKFESFTIKINPFRLHQLLLNLISNALDACIISKKRHESANIEGEVDISAVRNENRVQIIIRDNGCGIPKDKVDNIFNHSFTTKTTGTGVGLTTVKKIIDEELHGTISMKSEENEGTICTVIVQNT